MLGRLLADRYRLLRVVGEGGMGTVYEAEHVELSKRVALKLMHPRMDAGEQARQRFEREARAAAATGHENVIEVFDLGRDVRGSPFLVMELLEGVDLGRAIHRIGRLPAARTAWIVGQVLRALEAVHAVGIHHRDLKPDNVFLTRRAGLSDWVKVLDFGVAEMGVSEDGPRKLAAGTPHYMAPEQAGGAALQDARVDVYAAGVLLYECLTGELPFEAATPGALKAAIQEQRATPVRELAPDTDPEFARLIERAMAKRPEDRPNSARALYDALVPFGAGLPPQVHQFTPPAGSKLPVSVRLDELPQIQAADSDLAASMTAPSGGPLAHPRAREAVTFAPRPGPMAAEPHAFHASSAPEEARPQSAPVSGLASGARPTHARPEQGTPRLRGAWVSEIALELAEALGPAPYARLLESLPKDAGATFLGVLLPASWVDLPVLEALLEAAPTHLAARTLGREATSRILRRWASQARGAKSHAQGLPEWAAPLCQLTSGLSPCVVDAPAGCMKLCLTVVPTPSEALATALAGLLEALAKAAQLEVAATASARKGSQGCTASLTFHPR